MFLQGTSILMFLQTVSSIVENIKVWNFMPSHIHLIFRSSNDLPSELLRDFKKHTAKKVLEAIKINPQESRKEWLLCMFERAGKKSSNVSQFQFWQHHKKPIELWSPPVIKQKIDYIHDNPVDWKYSSATNFQEDHTILEIDEVGFLVYKKENNLVLF